MTKMAKPPEDKITDSCGCAFCDLNLPVLKDAKGKYHETYKHPGIYRVPCTNPSH